MSRVIDGAAKIVKGASVVFVGTIVGRILSLFSLALIVRSLSPEQFGDIGLAHTIVLLLGNIAVLGAGEGVTRLISSTSDERKHYDLLRSGYFVAIVGGTVSAIGIYLLREQIAEFLGTESFAAVLLAFLPFLFLYPISQVTLGGLRATKRSAAPTAARDLAPYIAGIVLFGAFALLGKAYFGAIGFWISIPLTTTLVGLFYLNQSFTISTIIGRMPRREVLHDLAAFSWPLAIGASFIQFMANVDVLMVGYFLNSTQVGYYKSIQPLTSIVGFMLSSFVFLYLPIATEYYSAGQFDSLKSIYATTTKWIVAIAYPVALTLAFFSSDIIKVFYTAEYVEGSLALSILTIGTFFRSLVGPNGATVSAIGRPKIDFYASGIGFVLNVVLDLLLIPQYGIAGAAIATATGFIVFNSFEIIFIYWSTGTQPFSANLLKPLVPTFGIALALWWVLPDNLGFFALAGVGVVILGSHLTSLIITRSLSRTDIEMLDEVEEELNVDLTQAKKIARYWVNDPTPERSD